MLEPPLPREVWSVTRLNREARVLLETGLPMLWVEGELSNFSAPSSGHWYFSLKDRNAQIRCAMFRTRNLLTRFRPREGQLVQVRGRIGLYEARGDYQLVVEQMEDAGLGALKRQFELLKERLAAEGLFATERKRALPKLPRRIGIVTSPTGAALHDILQILARRYACAQVLIFPAAVQGAAAAPALAAAIELACARGDCDVLILARGGGSLEDLWAFNDEALARAIFRSTIPVISGVGHEIDFTIADFVADVRAPTPSAAAQLVVPEREVLARELDASRERLRLAARRQLAHLEQRFAHVRRRLQLADPRARLTQQAQRLDELEQRMRHALTGQLRATRLRHESLAARLQRGQPGVRLEALARRAADLHERLSTAWRSRQAVLQQRLASAARALDGVSPLATIARGFAIVTLPDGTLVRDVAQVSVGDEVHARVARGHLAARVTGREIV